MPQNTLLDAIIGGLIVAATIWLMAALFRKILIPWYLDLTYSGVRLAGAWNCWYRGATATAPHQTISMSQSGRRLYGTIRLARWADESAADETMSFTGMLKGEKVVITYCDNAQPEIFFGSLILKVQQNGEALVGYVTGIEPTNLEIYSERRTWVKA